MLSERIRDAVAQSAALFVMPDMGTIVVRGPDRISWLNSLVTNDVQALRPGVVGYGLTLAKVGRILAELWISCASEHILIGLPRDRVAMVCEHLERHLIMEDATLEDATAAHSWAFAYGPGAVPLCERACARYGALGGAAPSMPGSAVAFAVPAARASDFHDAVTRSPGHAHSAPVELSEDAPPASLGEPGAVAGTREDWDQLRLHLLVPRFGIDFGEKNYPQEAWLEKTAICFSKGCYLGQEVVCRLEMRGHVSRRLAALKLERPAGADDLAAAPGQSVPGPLTLGAVVRARDVDTVVGAVSGAFLNRRLGATVALAMMARTHMDVGAEVRVGDVPAVVIEPAQARDCG